MPTSKPVQNPSKAKDPANAFTFRMVAQDTEADQIKAMTTNQLTNYINREMENLKIKKDESEEVA